MKTKAIITIEHDTKTSSANVSCEFFPSVKTKGQVHAAAQVAMAAMKAITACGDKTKPMTQEGAE